MKYNHNEPIYYVPYVRIIKPLIPLGIYKEISGEYAIHTENSIIGIIPTTELHIMVPGVAGINIVSVPIENVELFVKVLIPEFKLGQVVRRIHARDECGTFRIFEYSIQSGRIWYTDGWGVATNCASGVSEEELREATKEEILTWPVKYNDDLVKKKKPYLYKYVMSK